MPKYIQRGGKTYIVKTPRIAETIKSKVPFMCERSGIKIHFCGMEHCKNFDKCKKQEVR